MVAIICNVLQLLFTNDFDAAKYFWYTLICGILWDDSDTLDGFGTDKQVVMYHISCVYRRNYDYTYSSDNCPSHMGDSQLSTDAVDDMTLHQSTTLGKTENIIEKSIKLWELGIAPPPPPPKLKSVVTKILRQNLIIHIISVATIMEKPT